MENSSKVSKTVKTYPIFQLSREIKSISLHVDIIARINSLHLHWDGECLNYTNISDIWVKVSLVRRRYTRIRILQIDPKITNVVELYVEKKRDTQNPHSKSNPIYIDWNFFSVSIHCHMVNVLNWTYWTVLWTNWKSWKWNIYSRLDIKWTKNNLKKERKTIEIE